MAEHITILTPMRDAERHLPSYLQRLFGLEWPPRKDLRFIVVEGDSKDGTVERLQKWQQYDDRMTLVTCNTGTPKHGSVVNAERFRTLATVFNAGLEAVDLKWTHRVLMLPVDIEYDSDMLWRLAAWNVDAVSPLVFMRGVFYDLWAFSRQGEYFPQFPESAVAQERHLWDMDTIGGTMLIDAAILKAGVRYGEQEVDRDFSRAAKAAGFSLWADPTTKVYHRK